MATYNCLASRDEVRAHFLEDSMKLWTLLIACLIAFPVSTFAADDPEKMLAEFEAIKRPKLDVSRRDDQEYVKSYMAEQKAFAEKRAEFAREFYEKFPTH